ncbi:hypothetical protein MMC13_008110 [Lambiella insularis]|nr:hypothetical protein [Lambiella insularis]
MAYNPPAQYGAPPVRPYNSALPREAYPQEEYREAYLPNTRAQGGGYSASHNVRVQHRPPQNQQYQQPSQAWNRSMQQQAPRTMSDEPSSNYSGPYQSQTGYLQAGPHGSAYGHSPPEDQRRLYQKGNGVYPSQTPQQLGHSDQYDEHRSYREEERARQRPHRSHSDGDPRPSENAGHSRITPRSVQDHHNPHNNSKVTNDAQSRNRQNKPPKEKILASPTSPETLPWDNPFPTFPTRNKKSVQPPEVVPQRPATASSNRSQNYAHEQPQRGNGERARDNGWQQPAHEVAIKHSVPSNSRHLPSVSHPVHDGTIDFAVQPTKQSTDDMRALGEGMAIRNKPLRNGRPQIETGFNDSYSVPASPWQSNYAPGIQNNVNSPWESPQPMSHSSLPFRGNEYALQEEYNQVDRQRPSRNHNEPPHHPEDYHTRSINTNRSQSLDLDRGNHDQTLQTYRPSAGTFPAPEERYEDHLGSRYDRSDGSQQIRHLQEGRNARSPGERDMPNFAALSNERAGQYHVTAIDQQLHLQPQVYPTNLPPPTDRDGRGRQREQPTASSFAQQASRSRSQPNIKDQRQQTNQTYSHGFDGRNQIPPIRAITDHSGAPYNASFHENNSYMDPPTSRSQERPSYGVNQASNASQRSYTQQQGGPLSPSHGLPALQTTRSLDDRNGYPSASRSPANPFSPADSRGPNSSYKDRPRMNPPSERVYGSLTNPADQNRPNSAPSHRPSNPDSLPAHPAPIRPGLVSPPNSNQPKPPPVRQYNSVPSPSIQSNPSQSPPRTSTGNVESKAVTHEELQRLQQAVKAKPNDQKTQLLLAQKMVEAASVLASDGGRADTKTRNKNREKYIFDAHKLIKKLISGGYPEAMFYMADCHGSGLLGLQPDPKEAFGLYQSAAKLGHAQSAYRVAVCCEMGQEDGGGTRRDPLKAVQWYKRAATLGDTPAMYKMGMIQLKGLLGQPKNTREAVVWLKRAADRADAENPHALHELALLYESASGNDNIIRDEAYSKQLLFQAAELGYKFSQYRLGSAFEYGHLGCPIDPRQSIAWYSKAAVQEDHQSELALSGWYLTGSEGVLQQSDTEAYLWARKAALAGLAKAEYAMGYFTEVGIGAAANMDDAKRWYWRAASQNFPKARDRLEDLRKGGARMQKSRVSRSAVNKQSEGECSVM